MKARDLIRLLSDVDPDAEVMISAPLACSQGPLDRASILDIPTCGVETGTFKETGPWVMIQGTDVWGADPPLPPSQGEAIERILANPPPPTHAMLELFGLPSLPIDEGHESYLRRLANAAAERRLMDHLAERDAKPDKAPAGPLVHKAGPMEDGVQLCTRCGFVLSDYRNASYLIEDGPPLGWAPGPVTVYPGSPTMFMAGSDEDVPLCGGAPA